MGGGITHPIGADLRCLFEATTGKGQQLPRGAVGKRMRGNRKLLPGRTAAGPATAGVAGAVGNRLTLDEWVERFVGIGVSLCGASAGPAMGARGACGPPLGE
ncbi:hypothetical protein GCM10027610_097980 [Dactylosporangium cerinum]